MNKGLKSYTKQISQTIGNAGTISININKNDANMHMILPLASSIGFAPIELSLIYNHQDRNEDGLFGKGFKMNLFSHITDNGSTISIENADGSVDNYTHDVFNKETQCTLCRNGNSYGSMMSYTLKDKYGNTRSFSMSDLEYPTTISTKTETLAVDFTKTYPDVVNTHNDVIRFKRQSGNYNKIDSVIYSNDGISANAITNLHYDTEGRLVSVVFTDGTGLETAAFAKRKIGIYYGANSITLVDEISGERCVCTFDDVGKVVSVKSAFNSAMTDAQTTTITYDDNFSTVTDNLGNVVKCIFDNNNLPRYQMDDDGYVIETEFDSETKQMLSQSDPIATKRKESNLFTSESVSDFSKNGVSVSTANCPDTNFKEILGTSLCRISGTGTLSKTISYNGLATDNITAIIWGKVIQGTVQVTLSAGEQDSKKFEKCGELFDLMTLGTTAEKTFDSIELKLVLDNAIVEIGGIQILAKNFGSFYRYDSSGNMVQSGKGATSEIAYGANNLPAQSIGVDSTMIDYEYDSKGNLTKATTAYGVKVEINYDANNNPTKTTYSGKDGKKLVKEKTYTSDGRTVATEKDELGNTCSLQYDKHGNLTKVTDALNTITELSYANNGLLTKLLTKKGSESVSATYEYNEKHLLTKVTLANGSCYTFIYDINNRITTVKLNGYTSFSFVYDEKGNVTEQKYGNGDAFVFAYNDNNQVAQVKYKASSSSTPTMQFTFTYNDKKQLLSVSNKDGKVLRTYTYDADGRIVKVKTDATISFGYDNLGNVNKESVSFKNKTIHQSYDTVQRSKGAHPESLLATTFGQTDFLSTFERDGNIIKANSGYSPQNGVTLARDGIIPCARVSQNNVLQYVLPISSVYNNDCSCVQFWFKMDSINSKAQLFYAKSVYNAASFNAVIENKKIKMTITNSSGKSYVLFNSKYEVKEGWNFFAFDYYNRDDGAYYKPFSEYAFTLNAETQFSHYSESAKFVEMSLNTVFCIGNKPGASNNLNGYITALSMVREHRTLDKIKEYYRITQDYITDNQFVDADVKTVDFGQTNLYNVSVAVQDKWEIIPLHSDVVSLKGTKPVAFDLRRVSSADKDRTFNFNNKLKRYAYVADGSRLKYNFGQSKTGTIAMRAYTDIIAEKQYLFDGVDTNGKTISLYRGEDLRLYVNQNGIDYNTNLVFTTGVWHTVALSFVNQTSVSGSGTTTYVSQIRVYLDGAYCEIPTSYVSYSNLTINVGAKTTATRIDTYVLGSYYNSYPLYGQIEMLCANNVYNELSTLQTLANEMRCVSKTTEYDELGMLKKQDVHQDGKTIVANSYTYKTRADASYLSDHIKQERIRYGATSNVRSYTTDALGRVTGITDNVFGSHSYTYDYRGFLTKADSETFTYDGNGNIKTYNGINLGYHGTIKDKLISVGNDAVTYSSAASLNPIGWKNNSYKYEGRRLTRYTCSSGYYEYSYDENGLRILKKKNTGETTDFYYSGTNLVVEQGSNYRLDFLYDENRQLYGVIKDNASKYFYIKDCLGTILGIVNESGTLVAKYTYTAFGKCTVALNNDGIATMNPFRFKGYYLDSESGMYYCHTRYFVPEWGRWLNADNPGYLNFTNVNGLNLFAYCRNDFINSFDPSGQNSKWKDWTLLGLGAVLAVAAIVVGSIITGGLLATVVAGALVGAGTGYLISAGTSVVSQLQESNFTSVDPKKAFNAGLNGAATGALTGALAGGFSYGFANVGQAIGQKLGFELASSAISRTLHLGVNFFEAAGKITGTVVGSSIGLGISETIMGNPVEVIDLLIESSLGFIKDSLMGFLKEIRKSGV